MRKLLALALALALTPGTVKGATLLPPGKNCFTAPNGPAVTGSQVGTLASGSNIITGLTNTATLTTNTMLVTGGGFPAGTLVTSIDSPTQVHVSVGATTTGPAQLTFQLMNGSLAGGSVYFYAPSTQIFKSTWKDPTQLTLNTNPVVLDANGCAVIYGSGVYRQVLNDSAGNQVWDQLTASTDAGLESWAGLAGGTANAITVTAPNFGGVDGSVINFTAIATNSGATTLNASGFGAVQVLKDTTGGPVALAGGEITNHNVISVLYRATDNAFHLLNAPIPSPTAAASPLCGATGWKVSNDGSFPNTTLQVVADQLVMVSPTGAFVHRTGVALPLNFLVNGANGLDAGSIAPSSIYNIWMIDNGATAMTLASLSATAPTMPAGYTFKCRLGAVPTEGGANLRRTLTLGSETQLVDVQQQVVGPVGNCATNTFVGQTFSFLPPTAIVAAGWVSISDTHIAKVTSGSNSVAIVTGAVQSVLGNNYFLYYRVNVQTPKTVYWCSDHFDNNLGMTGWVDSVNAH